MTSSWLATILDQEQIEKYSGVISPRTSDVERLSDRKGTEVAKELGSRYVVRYLGANRLTDFLNGTTEVQWVTPTAISPEDLAHWLALPDPHFSRRHAILLDLNFIDVVRGPAWVKLGEGIEYFLPNGFSKAAIVDGRVIEVR